MKDHWLAVFLFFMAATVVLMLLNGCCTKDDDLRPLFTQEAIRFEGNPVDRTIIITPICGVLMSCAEGPQ